MYLVGLQDDQTTQKHEGKHKNVKHKNKEAVHNYLGQKEKSKSDPEEKVKFEVQERYKNGPEEKVKFEVQERYKTDPKEKVQVAEKEHKEEPKQKEYALQREVFQHFF